MDVSRKVSKFISYWYERYLLCIELYMVEPWERATIHVIFAVVFLLLWYFNVNFIMSSVGQLRSGQTHYTQEMSSGNIDVPTIPKVN